VSDTPPDILGAWNVALNTQLTSLEEFISFFEIETKDREIVPFVLKPPQIKLVRMIQKAWDEGHAAYVLVLKARQIGFSSSSSTFKARASPAGRATSGRRSATNRIRWSSSRPRPTSCCGRSRRRSARRPGSGRSGTSPCGTTWRTAGSRSRRSR